MRISRAHILAPALLTLAAGAVAHTNDHGLDARNFDARTNACTDFFQHADGGWLASNPIPAQYSTWSLDNEIGERNTAILKRVLEDAAAHPGDAGSTTQKIGDFYAAAMDEAAIDKAGSAPLKDDLAAIAALKSPADVAALIADWQVRGNDVLFDFEAQPDLKASGTDIAYAGQGGLGLPDRDYYLRDDAKSKKLLAQYRDHVARMLGQLGDANAKEEAGWIVALETRFAKASLDRVSLRDPSNSYHIVTLAQADAKTPHFSWADFFHKAGRDDVTSFSLAQPEFFAAADAALTDVPLARWQAWLRWRLIDADAPYLSKAFVDADFAFKGGVLRGAKQNLPRYKRAIRSADMAVGELLGQAYVAQVFPPQAKQHAQELVDNLKTAMRARIAALTWMSAATKKSADAKLDTMVAKIGYPDHWRDYSKLQITRASWIANVRAARAFEARRQFAKLDKPVDRSEWDMTPQTVNAYYNPMGNEIVFPAAQLLPPYFDAKADDALNYGGIGSVIGHEMTHAFDDEGSQFDAKGNLANWWTAEDRKQFDARAQKLVDQFNAYVPLDDLHINGKLTLGENIADLGGLLVAYDAFKLTPQGKGDAKIDGLSPDQRFFHAYAQIWRTAQRPAQLRLQVQSNEHAPAKFRANGPLADIPAFARAFACKAGDAMVRPASDIVEIW
ncbi:MAG: M13 family metallopeptidase [Proteobacteria bacterium]|nr:M13 family metallopeptidase [Pseudomonadota bacterium]